VIVRKCSFFVMLLSNQCFPNPLTMIFNECSFSSLYGRWAVMYEDLDNMDSEMSESRFRSRISQQRMTEGWKREGNSMQKRTVRTVVIKMNLGGGKKRKEREGQGTWQTKEMRGLRMGQGQGANSGSVRTGARAFP